MVWSSILFKVEVELSLSKCDNSESQGLTELVMLRFREALKKWHNRGEGGSEQASGTKKPMSQNHFKAFLSTAYLVNCKIVKFYPHFQDIFPKF